MGSGLASSPTKAQLVSTLAAARRSIAALRARHQNVDGWLSSEVRLRGIRENAATVAALEIPELRDRVATNYAVSTQSESSRSMRFLISSD